jgi:hypothetical protein
MPPVRRRLLHLLTALSLLLCVAVCVLWVRSYRVGDSLDWETRDGRAGVGSLRGRISAGVCHVEQPYRGVIPRGVRFTYEPAAEAADQLVRPQWSMAGVQAARMFVPGVSLFDVRIPHAYVAALLAALPAARLVNRRRRRAGLCQFCGYDLRATPDRCPECGHLAVAPQETVAPRPAAR